LNKIVEHIEEEEKPKAKPSQDEAIRLTEKVRRMADFDFRLTKEQLYAHLRFLGYIFLLFVLFIYNSHYAEKTIRTTNKLQYELKDLRSEYITVLSEIMSESRQSELLKKLELSGIKELKNPPSKITY
jgi:hypothetical protein